MITVSTTVFSCAANYSGGRKCIFCDSFKVYKIVRRYVMCKRCGKTKSLTKLRRKISNA